MKNGKPEIFIGSSKEGKENANQLQLAIKDWSVPTVWHEIFDLSKTLIENLENNLKKFDMCVFLWTADDVAVIRGEEEYIARDNLVFEAGLSYGYIDRKNTIIVVEKTIEKSTKMLSDLYGVTFLPHDFNTSMNMVNTKLEEHYKKNEKDILKNSLKNNPTADHKGMISWGRKLIKEATKKIVFVGGDVSWIDEFFNDFEELNEKDPPPVSIEVFFSISEYEELGSTPQKNKFESRMKKLKEIDAKISCFKNNYELRCIIIDPDGQSGLRVLHAKREARDVYRIIRANYDDNESDYIAYSDIYKLINEEKTLKSWDDI